MRAPGEAACSCAIPELSSSAQPRGPRPARLLPTFDSHCHPVRVLCVARSRQITSPNKCMICPQHCTPLCLPRPLPPLPRDSEGCRHFFCTAHQRAHHPPHGYPFASAASFWFLVPSQPGQPGKTRLSPVYNAPRVQPCHVSHSRSCCSGVLHSCCRDCAQASASAPCRALACPLLLPLRGSLSLWRLLSNLLLAARGCIVSPACMMRRQAGIAVPGALSSRPCSTCGWREAALFAATAARECIAAAGGCRRVHAGPSRPACPLYGSPALPGPGCPVGRGSYCRSCRRGCAPLGQSR